MKWQHHALGTLSGKGRSKALTTLVVSESQQTRAGQMHQINVPVILLYPFYVSVTKGELEIIRWCFCARLCPLFTLLEHFWGRCTANVN